MTDPTNVTRSPATVPEEAFEAFLKELEAKKVPAHVVNQFRVALLADKDLSEDAIRSALFASEQLP